MLEVNKITAGIPGLSPQHRSAVTAHERNTQTQTDAAHEATLKADAAIEDDGGVDTTNLLAQMGRGMDSGEVIRRLRKLNSNLIFEPSKNYPDHVGVYIADKQPDGTAFKRHVCCATNSAWVPEFSVRHSKTVDAGGTKVKQFSHETRGWRTTGLKLVRAGFINLEQFEKAFALTQGRSSKNWKQFTT